MLGTGARYAEFGITGGFFLFTQALILWLAYPDVVSGAHSFGVQLTAIVDEIPEEARPAIQSLLVALALLSVFIIGLVLEIIGSVFMLYEANVFRKYLLTNQWIAKFVEAEVPYYAEDYSLFLDLASGGILFPRSFAEWKKRFFFGSFRYQRQLQQRFRRLEAVLIAKVLTSGAKTEMLAEQISICRMSRSIGTALWAVSIGCALWAVYFEVFQAVQLRNDLSTVFGFALLMLGVVCAPFIVIGAYSRFANMLFSLVYASWKPAPPNSRESAGGGILKI